MTARLLQHPRIVGTLRGGEVDGVPCFVMPYVEGESLATHIRRNGRSSVRDAVAVFRDVARALALPTARTCWPLSDCRHLNAAARRPLPALSRQQLLAPNK